MVDGIIGGGGVVRGFGGGGGRGEFPWTSMNEQVYNVSGDRLANINYRVKYLKLGRIYYAFFRNLLI